MKYKLFSLFILVFASLALGCTSPKVDHTAKSSTSKQEVNDKDQKKADRKPSNEKAYNPQAERR